MDILKIINENFDKNIMKQKLIKNYKYYENFIK